jgi:penicillin-binding protein 2
MATAMLESKQISENFTAYCPGYANFYGRTFHCWRPQGHGVVGLHAAIVDSCDVFFYNVGKLLGIDTISHYASGLGFGKRTGIDLPGEEPGLVPSEEWVERVYHHKWYAGETISVSVGQGAVTVTPIQLARMAAAVASGGNLVQPHLLKNFANSKVDHFAISDNTVEQVTQGLYGVVNEGGGTGYHLRLQNIDLCGKSGTAQLMSYDAAKRLGTKTMDGWFVGFAPRRNPEIVIAAIVQDTMEHGGEAAGPVVRDIVKAYYDKKNARTLQQATTDSPAQPNSTQPLVATVGAKRP